MENCHVPGCSNPALLSSAICAEHLTSEAKAKLCAKTVEVTVAIAWYERNGLQYDVIPIHEGESFILQVAQRMGSRVPISVAYYRLDVDADTWTFVGKERSLLLSTDRADTIAVVRYEHGGTKYLRVLDMIGDDSTWMKQIADGICLSTRVDVDYFHRDSGGGWCRESTARTDVR